MVLYRLSASFVVLAFMMGAVAITAAAWLAVVLVGLLHPKLSPRRACDWFRELICESVDHVRAQQPW